MQWFAQAPANIALIKYMGKKDAELNIPDNASLSYTLKHLFSSVELEQIPGKKDIWEPLVMPGAAVLHLSPEEQARFIGHLARLKKHFGYEGGFLIESCNNFPHGTGLASSASSFAALTQCASLALSELTGLPLQSVDERAALSRLGSGSSCRSFYEPWALWCDDQVSAIALPYHQLLHQVIIVSHTEKKISSRQAHQRAKSSPFYAKRHEEVPVRLEALLEALQSKNWSKAYGLCWDEFQDMHRLFSTCDQPFSYMTEQSRALLVNLETLWADHGDGPIVTMDAGPNIHLLYRPDQEALAQQFKVDYLLGNYDIL